MCIKQDRTYARTAQDLERKYQFGKTFADMLGLINDNRDKVDSVESELRSEITKQATELRRNTEEIVAKATETISNDISELEKEVEMKIDADGVSIVVQEELANGVDRVETKTGYTFDYDGLTISKSGEEMSNVIDNTGMYVTRSGTSVLTANNAGVEALNVAVKTWLIVGENSRFEDYGLTRTGCFWIGG
jgi:hypothetical protein